MSALLFGMLVAVPASTFVGCSDYDDDISGLNTTTGDLRTQIDKQVTALNDAKTALEAEIAQAKTDAANASAALQTAVSNAQSSADDASNAAAKAAAAAAEAKLEAATATEAAAQAKVDAINEAKAACQKMIDNLNAATKDDVATLSGKISAIENNLSQIDLSGIEDKQTKMQTALTTAQEQLEIQKAALEAYEKKLNDHLNGYNADIQNAVKDLVKASDVESKIAALKKTLESEIAAIPTVDLTPYSTTAQVQSMLDTKLADVTKQTSAIRSELVTILGKALKGLVFRPDFYYHGIEAMNAATFDYDVLTTEKVDADGNYGTDAPTNTTKTVQMTPALTATYHLNPSNAEISTDKSQYSFRVLNADYVRANVIEPSVFDVTTNKADGTVTVKSSFGDSKLIKDIEGDAQVTVMALQYQAKDTVITSDYAAVKATTYNTLKLNLAKSNHAGVSGDHIHLYEKAADAIANIPQLEIEYDGQLDIDEYINTHRSVVGGTADQKWDNNAKSGKVEECGFKYSYDLVGYHSGSNATSETAHLAIKDHILRAQMPKDGKQAEWGNDQNRAEINRMPLVRVTLTDTIHNKIAAVGYVKLIIVDKIVTPTTEVTTTDKGFDITDAYTVNCATESAHSKTMTWYEVEESVIAKLNIPKSEFDTNWELLTYSGSTHAQQFADTKAASNCIPEAQALGVIEEVVNAGAHETTVIKWTVGQNEAYTMAKAGTKEKTIYIRFRHKTNGSLVTMPFNYRPSAQNISPEGSIADSKKINEYWYAHNQNTNSGYDEIHGNVEVVGQTDADDEFVFDIKDALVGNKIAKSDLNLKNIYSGVNNAAEIKMVFVKSTVNQNVPGVSGSKYTLSVSNDGSKLEATKNGVTKTIATIVTTGTDMGKVTYEKNDFSEDLLNYADHTELADYQTLTGRVNIVAATCDPAKDIKLTGNAFDVKFLRPISIRKPGEATLVDATTGGATAKVTFQFVDWREHDFNNSSVTGGHNYYDYYGVRSIVAHDGYEGGTSYNKSNDKITTTMNGSTLGKDYLAPITEKVKFRYIAPTGTLVDALNNGDFGKVYYENNGLTVQDFKIRIPVTVTYDWGTIETYIDVTIKRTQQNAPRR